MRQIPKIHLWPIKWIKRKVENFLLSNNMGERAQQFLNKFQQPGHPQRGRANSSAGISTFKKKKRSYVAREENLFCSENLFSGGLVANEKPL